MSRKCQQSNVKDVVKESSKKVKSVHTAVNQYHKKISLHNLPTESNTYIKLQKTKRKAALSHVRSQISKNALSCPHCGEPMAQSTDSLLSSKDSKESLLGFGGAILLSY